MNLGGIGHASGSGYEPVAGNLGFHKRRGIS